MNRGRSATTMTGAGPAAQQVEWAIQARDLVKTYTGGVRALQGLSFTVEAGTIFGLLGPNGAGKSTIDAGAIVTEGTPDELKSELRGDAIQVELNDLQPKETVFAALGQIGDGLREVTLDRRTLRARVDSGAHAIPAVLAVLETAGITVLAATVARPSLDDVYLRHVGRAFSDADKGEDR